ncbi:MAG: hypothetical protein ACRDBM_01925 [Sporomusa sp.]
MTAIKTRIEELEAKQNKTLSAEQVALVIKRYREGINKKDPESLRALLTTFVDRIIISSKEMIIKVKIVIDLDGAREGT